MNRATRAKYKPISQPLVDLTKQCAQNGRKIGLWNIDIYVITQQKSRSKSILNFLLAATSLEKTQETHVLSHRGPRLLHADHRGPRKDISYPVGSQEERRVLSNPTEERK